MIIASGADTHKNTDRRGHTHSFSQVISSEDSDSPAVYGDLFPSSGVPSGIVL